ncbi:hypothetical protein ACFO9E_31505 [Streptomyces maoxianensis]|uniref:Uncharacterized protein n=1 Tax=Streptomyces maoxianensis TaxID=1459942 RepID=A0ABV9GGW9_9ACTN
MLLVGAKAAAYVAAAGQKVFASRRWPLGLRRSPHQVTLVARCLTEAACLRTVRLLHGDPRKIVLVRSGTAVASGNHRAPGHKPDPDALACVHHFKWRSGVLDDLWRRAERFAIDDWAERTPAVRDEASRLLEHIDRQHGRIDVADTRLAFRHVTLDRLPDGWAAEARSVATCWRPPAAAKGRR